MAHPRHRILPASGTLLVSGDLHGNGDDFRRLRQLFVDMRSCDPQTHWLILGDLVHAPCDPARDHDPALYDFADESWPIVEGVAALQRELPDNVHLLLGNHDHGHVGGPHTGKFFADEVQNLEEQLTAEQRRQVCGLFDTALLIAVAPCGVLFSHGSPDDRLRIGCLERLSLVYDENDASDAALLRSILTSYGQPPEVTDRMLAAVSEEVGFPLRLVIHGHDRAEEGWLTEGDNQLCPVVFGAPRHNKRYVVLDLSGRYRSVLDIEEGVELRRLYAEQ